MRPLYPFSALVGQTPMKLALVLNAINPRLGGVLIRGQKGTAKSTAARGLAWLLPPVDVVIGCRFGCEPRAQAPRCPDCAARGYPMDSSERPAAFVELPIGATEDRVLGTLDFEKALADGRRHFEPGLLARANRGLLYVDEVNLLPDHLVDTLLDAAAMGTNTVERDGVSYSHPAAFVLVGTMNPEEGELRPQLLDRFALAVDVEGMPDVSERAEVVRRRVAFEADPVAFGTRWAAAERAEQARIQAARELLPRVQVGDALLELIARICAAFEVDGLRADIVTYKAAATLAAYAGRERVTPEDVRRAAELALLHRRRRQPFDQPGLDRDRLDEIVREQRDEPPDSAADGDDDHAPPREPPRGGPDAAAGQPSPAAGQGDASQVDREEVFEVAQHVAPRSNPPEARTAARPKALQHAARRGRTVVEGPRGRHVRSSATRTGALDVLATVRSAALRQRSRPVADDLRFKVRVTPVGALTVFVVDASGSMAARRRMALAKGAVLSLLQRAYQTRDEVALIAFRGTAADVLLPPTSSVQLASVRLRALPTGGRTPLALALQRAGALLAQRTANGGPRVTMPRLVLVSDGRANVALADGDPYADALAEARRLRASNVGAVVVDAEEGAVQLGRARTIAGVLGARYMRLVEMS